MSSTTNTAINSRSMNGVISISDGVATLENGDLDCDDIIFFKLISKQHHYQFIKCNGQIRM